MTKRLLIALSILCGIVGMTVAGMAQLPADPWANKTPITDKFKTRKNRAKVTAVNTLHQKLPDFVGENTTWAQPMGQKETAPDTNITNILLMTQHLRNMGYQIPDGLDTLISTAPQKLRGEIATAMIQLRNSSHPVATIETSLADIFEKNTGLSLNNLIMNSLRIIDARR